jgi:hypothetical protein
MRESDLGMSIGMREHDFLFEFVRFLVAQNLADVDFGDCLIDVTARQMTPVFIAPLTWRGRALVALIHVKESELVNASKLPDAGGLHVAQEGFVTMETLSYLARLPRLFQFQSALRPSIV